jgi:hypothetical protein
VGLAFALKGIAAQVVQAGNRFPASLLIPCSPSSPLNTRLLPVEIRHLRNEDKMWVTAEIRAATQRPEVRGIKKALNLLREWSLVGTAVTVFLALVAIVVTVAIFASSNINRDAEFRGSTDQRLKSIEQTLSVIQNRLGLVQAQIVAQKYAAVPPKELKAHSEELKQLKTTVAQASPDTPGYWPIAFQVIQLASQSTFADWDKIKAQGETEYDDVSSKPPGAFGVMENQRAVLRNHVEGLTFKNSIIRFEPNVELVNDVFINCVFLLPVQDNPSKPLQEIGRTLLASDLSNVTLNAS